MAPHSTRGRAAARPNDRRGRWFAGAREQLVTFASLRELAGARFAFWTPSGEIRTSLSSGASI